MLKKLDQIEEASKDEELIQTPKAVLQELREKGPMPRVPRL
jgi:hypothetical protein